MDLNPPEGSGPSHPHPAIEPPPALASLARLLKPQALVRLRKAHVAIIGIGGVGSWVAEALARSGIGSITLVDLDEICVSNLNRQVHAVQDTVGRPKVDAMKDRILAIDPGIKVHPVQAFFTGRSSDDLLDGSFSLVVDAIDSVPNKTLLLAACRARRLPVVSSGAAGGRLDPTRIRTADLNSVTHDRLLGEVRRQLRQKHQLPNPPDQVGIQCVYSTEPVTVRSCESEGRPSNPGPRLDCNGTLGSAVHVTGVFGLVAAATVIRSLADDGSTTADSVVR